MAGWPVGWSNFLYLYRIQCAMLQQVQKIIEDICKDESMDWLDHIESVAKYADLLAKKLSADREIVALAAWLHDITRIKGKSEDHHITGAKEAERILSELGYPKDKIDQVTHCILTHRGSKPLKKDTKEAEILASADGLSHFDRMPELLYHAFVNKGLPFEEGKAWLRKKLEGSWNKCMPEAKNLLANKYELIMELLA